MSESNLSFEDSMQLTEDILQDLESEQNISDIISRLKAILAGHSSCRGFFVTYLTSNSKFSDEPPEILIEQMKQFHEYIPELLCKNLVMSTCMRLNHLKSNNEKNAIQSEIVSKRCKKLIRRLIVDIKEIKERLLEMNTSLSTKTGVYADFINRWNYDKEQISAAKQALAEVLEN